MPASEGKQEKPEFLHLSYFRVAKSKNVDILAKMGGKTCQCQIYLNSFFRIIIKVEMR